ncbi:MAG: hypothetical protein OEW29_16225, partial [Acidimicrobiia bacterium]|nr:hypothetical protein [Acidimicrobiia bacterium]
MSHTNDTSISPASARRFGLIIGVAALAAATALLGYARFAPADAAPLGRANGEAVAVEPSISTTEAPTTSTTAEPTTTTTGKATTTTAKATTTTAKATTTTA